MAPIRIALIGLSASAKVNWAEQAHLPYLLSPRGKSHYEIVALLNSSVQAAEKAREQYNLPSCVKVYGSPDNLAADPDVDLVVCNTRVDTHLATTAPSLRKGKAVYIEWPLAESYDAAVGELDARVDDAASIIGLQGRVSPVALKLKEVLRSGRIGKVLSSDVRAFRNLGAGASVADSLAVPESLAYFTDRKVGGNHITIAFAHTIDYVHSVLGEFDLGTMSSRMQVQRPVLRISDTNREVMSDVPDLLAVHGRLVARGDAERGISIAEDATLSFTFRSGQQFKGQPGLVWTINGEKGEIMVTASGAYFHMDPPDYTVDVKLHDHETDQVEDIEWDWQAWQKELPSLSRNVAELYERFADWWENGRAPGDLPEEREWPRVHDALGRLNELKEMFRQYDRQRRSETSE
ncbi:oxidoreductase family protein [Xylariaceae sp. FL0594]|nr:oxidoreductase family protein [Xylariaceae sp. FL0594]